MIMTFSAYRLLGRSRMELKDDRLAGLFGFLSGGSRGAYGMNGPPLVAYGRCGVGPLSGFGRPCKVLPARQPGWHGRILGRRSLGPRGDAVLPHLLARGSGGDRFGPRFQSAHGWATVSLLRARGPGGDRWNASDPVGVELGPPVTRGGAVRRMLFGGHSCLALGTPLDGLVAPVIDRDEPKIISPPEDPSRAHFRRGISLLARAPRHDPRGFPSKSAALRCGGPGPPAGAGGRRRAGRRGR